MKHKILLFLFSSLLVHAEVSTFIPYYGNLDYGDEGHRKDGKVYGFYASTGDLSSLLEFNYLHSTINEKINTSDSLKQDDFTVIYGRYFKSFALKGGLHFISTTDADLENGYTLILGASKWHWFGYDKLTYGLDYYYSRYESGTDLARQANPIAIYQYTPYISYSKSINANASNTLSIKANFESVPAFKSEDSYTSYEIENTFYYKKASLGAGVFNGEMRVGIQDGGMSIFNLKDKQTEGYHVKLGYEINDEFTTDLSYASKSYEEYLSSKNTKSSLVVLAIKYTF